MTDAKRPHKYKVEVMAKMFAGLNRYSLTCRAENVSEAIQKTKDTMEELDVDTYSIVSVRRKRI